MDAGNTWRDFILKWPRELPRSGVLVTTFDEQIPFDGFLTTDTIVLLERRTPDTIGARKVMIAYADIRAIKLVDVIRGKTLNAAGFAGELPERGG